MPENEIQRSPASHAPLARNPSREDLALQEIGHTEVSRGVAAALMGVFLASIAIVPVVQQWSDFRAAGAGEQSSSPIVSFVHRLSGAFSATPRDGASLWQKLMGVNRELLGAIDTFEDALEDESNFSNAVLPRVQAVFARLGAGNEEAYVGRDGWLFFRPDVDHLTGPGFLDSKWIQRRTAASGEWESKPAAEALPTVVHFRDQLAARGIQLVVVPTPSKATVHPGRVSARFAEGAHPVNPSFDEFVARLGQAGVAVFDPLPALLETASDGSSGPFLATDTHWRPEAMERVAAHLAAFLKSEAGLSAGESARFTLEEARISNVGDIATMLRLPKDQDQFLPEEVGIRRVLDRTGAYWRPGPDAEVLVLGDSFSNIFSLAEMGWGESAGLVEHLSFQLQRPVDAILRNDAGSHATREMLARDLRRGNDRLAGKRVVVWQFAVRELSFGDWKQISLELGEPAPREFLVPAAGESWTVTGLVEEVSAAPRPGSVPYKDHIIAVHLADVVREGETAARGDAVVYLWSMRDNVWTPAARLRRGAEVKLRLESWAAVSPELERINRSELADENLQFEEPCWGELIFEP